MELPLIAASFPLLASELQVVNSTLFAASLLEVSGAAYASRPASAILQGHFRSPSVGSAKH